MKTKQLKYRCFYSGLCRYCLAALVLCLISTPVSARDYIQLDVPVLINGAFRGDISASIEPGSADRQGPPKVMVSLERLHNLLGYFAVQEQLSQWFINEQEKELSLGQLRQRGLEIEFDESLLNISVRMKLLGLNSISLRGNREPVPEDGHAQAKIAGGANFFARNTFSHRSSIGNESGFDETAIDVAGFFTIGGFGGWSLFYEADYLENDEREFARQDITVVRDNFKKGVRYSFGDISPQTSGLQNSPELLGFGIERDYREINPFRNINPRGRSDFTLDRAAEVSFEVNGVIVDIQTLEPGRYSIEDFPLTNGANNVKVIVDDGTSRVEVANFSPFVDLSLLDAGLSNFGLNVGVRRKAGTGRSVRYESDPVLVGFYERGINQKLTLGAQVEARQNHALIGSTAVYGSRVGLIGLETAVSDRSELGTGYRARLRHEFSHQTKSNWLIESDFQFDYTSDRFVNLDQDDATGAGWIGNASLTVGKGSLSLTLGGFISDVGDQTNKAITASLFKSFNRFTLSLDYQISEFDNETDSRFGVSVRAPFGGSSLRTSFRSDDDEYELDWTRPRARSAGSATFSGATVRTNNLLSELELDAEYIGSRFEINAQHRNATFVNPFTESVADTDISVGGSIGFADGKFAYGRPFTSGFVIVDQHKTLRGSRIAVRGSGGSRAVTSTKRLSSTLVPINRSYIEQSFVFDVDDLPIGYDIGAGSVNLFPGNLAGYRYTIGSDASNTVLGTVAWPDNEPLELKSGKLIPLDGGEDIVVFTNRTGRFVAEKVAFGKYRMEFTRKGVLHAVNIELKETDKPGLVKIGALVLEQVVEI